ncbi:MAG TPA: phenol hydroxylase subunit P4 [Variovorax sp.]|nr:phenol hydroxylase subunit P4 [Variovorax sp.]
MPVIALKPGYAGAVADAEERFHGNRLLYIGWQDHLMFCSPVCIPVPADMPFGALVSEVLPTIYASHPDFAQIEWSQVAWRESGRPWQPDASKSLADNGLVHKSFIQFRSPGLNGLQGSHS